MTGWDIGERSHNGMDGTPTGAVSGVEGWEQSAPPHSSRGLGVVERGHHFLVIETLNSPESQRVTVPIIAPH